MWLRFKLSYTFCRLKDPPTPKIMQVNNWTIKFISFCHKYNVNTTWQKFAESETWYSPTPPEISSFPKSNRKSVTLSRTATLQRRRRNGQQKKWRELGHALWHKLKRDFWMIAVAIRRKLCGKLSGGNMKHTFSLLRQWCTFMCKS